MGADESRSRSPARSSDASLEYAGGAIASARAHGSAEREVNNSSLIAAEGRNVLQSSRERWHSDYAYVTGSRQCPSVRAEGSGVEKRVRGRSEALERYAQPQSGLCEWPGVCGLGEGLCGLLGEGLLGLCAFLQLASVVLIETKRSRRVSTCERQCG